MAADILSTVTSADLVTMAGGKILISAGLPATHDQAGFEALTFTQIGGSTDLPSISGSANLVSFDLLSEGYTSKRKGQKSYGAGSCNYATVPSDAGQIIAAAAALSDSEYSFKLLYSNGAVDYGQGLVMGAPKNNGTADTVQANAMAIEWTSTAVPVAAP